MPTPKMPDFRDWFGNRATMESVWLRFVNRDVAALKFRLTADTPDEVRFAVDTIDDELNPALIREMDASLMRNHLNSLIDRITAVRAQLRNTASAASASAYSGPPALTNDQIERLRAAIKVVGLLAVEVEGGQRDALIETMFATEHVAAVKKHFQQLPTTLSWHADRTVSAETFAAQDKAKTPPLVGFVADATLPGNMPLLAVGSGPEAYIKVRPQSLNEAADQLFITQLVHEGSHVVSSEIIDWVYRDHNLHLALPAAFRLQNAANYEHLALGLMDPVAGDAGAPQWDLPTRALTLLRFKITRAWVRSFEVLNPTAPRGREDVVKLLGAEPSPIGAEASRELITDLQSISSHALDMAVQSRMRIEGPAPYRVIFGGGQSVDLNVGGNPPTASGIAYATLVAMIHRLAGRGLTASEPQMVEFTHNIANYDRAGLSDRLDLLYNYLNSDGPR